MSSSDTLNSELVEVKTSHKPDCIVELDVHANPPIVMKAYKKALRAVAKEVTLPGFRKGKAPDKLIEKNYGKAVDEQWQKSIADEAFKEAQSLTKVPVLNNDTRISFNMKSHSKENGADMTFSFETEPTVPEVDISSLELQEEEKDPVDDKKIQESIDQVRSFFGEKKPIAGRGAKEGDFVKLDIFLLDDPNTEPLKDMSFQVSNERMSQWMRELVTGMKPGEEREGISKPDADASEEDKEKFQEKKVRVVLTALEEQILPPIDDELAKKMGAENAEKMRTNIENLLKKQSEEKYQKAMRDQLSDLLVEKITFDLPKSLIDNELRFRLKQIVDDPSYQEKLRKMSEEEQKAFIEEIKGQATKALRLFYISQKVLEDSNIQVSPEEVQHEINNPVDAAMWNQSQEFNPKTNAKEQQALVLSRLMLAKAQDHLIEKAPKVAKSKSAPKASAASTTSPKKTTATPKKKTAAKKAPAKKTAKK